jgi:predicted molibdopterin-dependent oxidoreductase YjgC
MTVTVHVDGRALRVPDGMTLTAALVQGGVRAIATNPVSKQPRGPFCGMGICFECEIFVDGELVRACLTPAADGMTVETAAATP